ncbi:MAG TPA: hypothetical protein VMZ28_17410, partial [Kofleriaceae bacterium]|nr:hypothetical protein [Kofleriaceae bacterium]
LLDYARQKHPADQLVALEDWLQGYEFAEIAERRSLATPRDADKLVRAALAKLRRHVNEG